MLKRHGSRLKPLVKSRSESQGSASRSNSTTRRRPATGKRNAEGEWEEFSDTASMASLGTVRGGVTQRPRPPMPNVRQRPDTFGELWHYRHDPSDPSAKWDPAKMMWFLSGRTGVVSFQARADRSEERWGTLDGATLSEPLPESKPVGKKNAKKMVFAWTLHRPSEDLDGGVVVEEFAAAKEADAKQWVKEMQFWSTATPQAVPLPPPPTHPELTAESLGMLAEGNENESELGDYRESSTRATSETTEDIDIEVQERLAAFRLRPPSLSPIRDVGETGTGADDGASDTTEKA